MRRLNSHLCEVHLSRFKPLAYFDWSWPKKCDRTAIEELMGLQFLADASSVVLFSASGFGSPSSVCSISRKAHATLTKCALNAARSDVLAGNSAGRTRTCRPMMLRHTAGCFRGCAVGKRAYAPASSPSWSAWLTIKACAALACLAAVKIAVLSLFKTFSQDCT